MNKIAIIIPCFNEELSLEVLHHEVKKELATLSSLPILKNYRYQIIYVNDGSTDSTQNVIEKISKKDRATYYIQLASNTGHQAALRAGLTAASNYEAAITLDADMQHPPKYISKMLEQWLKGYKVVQMVRNDSIEQVGYFKYLTSKAFYTFFRFVSGINLEYGSSDFRLMDRSVLAQLELVTEPQLFLRGYFATLHIKKTNLKYMPEKRYAGKSKYSLNRMLRLAKDGILQFSVRPLYFSIAIGLAVALSGVVYGLIVIMQQLQGAHYVSGWSSLIVAVLFLFGFNFILLGVIGLYLAQNIRIVRRRPDYVIEKNSLI